MTEKFSVVFESDVVKVKEVVGSALDFLRSAFPIFSEEDLFETKLIISEALLNAVTHGNDGDNSKKVSLKINTRDNFSVLIQIADEGVGFDYDAVLKGMAEDGIMKEYGRGVRLVYLLSDGIAFNKRGNKLEIYKKVSADE